MSVGVNARALFFDHLKTLPSPRVLELGTKRSIPERSTTHKAELLALNPRATHVGSDLEDGLDVDVRADAHRLSERFPTNAFDGFIAASVFEHLRWPWIVALELNAVLKVGGMGFVMSHQTFPLHGFPHDYWRFSKESWSSLFCEETGWRVLRVDYDFPCRVVPADEIPYWNHAAEAYLNSNVCVQKIAAIPSGTFRWPVNLDAPTVVSADRKVPPSESALEPSLDRKWWYQFYRRISPAIPSGLRGWGRAAYFRRAGRERLR